LACSRLWPWLAAVIGVDRERAVYPTVLIVITSYSVLFARRAEKVTDATGD
jgi:hypothetical protein